MFTRGAVGKYTTKPWRVRANGLAKGDSEATPQFGLIAKEVAGCPLDASGLISHRLDWNEDNLTTDHFRYEGKPALADKLANKSGLAVRSFRLFVEGML